MFSLMVHPRKHNGCGSQDHVELAGSLILLQALTQASNQHIGLAMRQEWQYTVHPSVKGARIPEGPSGPYGMIHIYNMMYIQWNESPS